MPTHKFTTHDPERPAKVFAFAVAHCLAHHGRFPTTRQISDEFKMGSTSSAVNTLTILARQGKVARDGKHWYVVGALWLPPMPEPPAQPAAPAAEIVARSTWQRLAH